MGPLVKGFDWYVPYKVVGWPKPTVHWMLNGAALLESDNVIFNNEVRRDCNVKDSASVVCGLLELRVPSHRYNGNYTLIVENQFGSDNQTKYFTFMDPPSTDY
jgi:hypothetical protein